MSWWDSVEALRRFNTGANYAIAVFGVLTAVATIVSIRFSNRIDELLTVQEQSLANRLEQTESTLESTRQELEETKQRQQPRALTADQRQQLVVALGTASPKGRVEVIAVLGDGEAHAFAMALLFALQEAGWPADGVSDAIYTDAPVAVAVVVQSANQPPPHAVPLQRALRAAGIEAHGRLEVSKPPGTVELLVGRKP